MNELDENINEYDESRRILELIRENNRHKGNRNSSLITEAAQPDRIELDQNQRKDEEKKFRDVISPRVEFNKFIIYPKSGNVTWSGKFRDSDNEWFFSLDDTHGVYISCESLRLDNTMLDTIKKLVGFYENWADEWANKVADEYRNVEPTEGGESTEETPESTGTEEMGKGL